MGACRIEAGEDQEATCPKSIVEDINIGEL